MVERIRAWLKSLSSFDLQGLKLPIIAYIIVMPMLAVLFGSVTAALVFVLSGLVALLLLRAEDITELKFLFALHAKLEKSISEANATISQLRALASTLAGPVIAQMALSGQFMKYETTTSKQATINKIAQYLKQIGVSDDEIDGVMAPWKLLAGPQVFGLIHARLTQLNPAKAADLMHIRTNARNDESDEKPEAVKQFLDTLQLGDARLTALRQLYRQVSETGYVDDPLTFNEPEEPQQLPAPADMQAVDNGLRKPIT